MYNARFLTYLRDGFNPLKPKLIDFIRKLNSSSDKPDDSILSKKYDEDKQYELSFEIIKKLNFQFGHGRQDKSTHPFTASIAALDTRITTRTKEDYLNECIFFFIISSKYSFSRKRKAYS